MSEVPGVDKPGGAGAFDFSALQQALNDPSIKTMAEQIANDDNFKEVTKILRESFGSMMKEQQANVAPDIEELDPSKYMNAMAGMLGTPEFLKKAEALSKNIIENDPNFSAMRAHMEDPEYREKVESSLKLMKEDPELQPVLIELEKIGPLAMMKYWNNPEMLSKLGKAMDGNFDFQGIHEAEGHEEEFPGGVLEDDTVHAAASAGDVEALRHLLQNGADPDKGDEEGRTALHFACGYGELECATVLIAANANLNKVDNNMNTALHYASGYGQPLSVKLLIESGADRSALNADNKTALEVAQLNGQEDVIKALSV